MQAAIPLITAVLFAESSLPSYLYRLRACEPEVVERNEAACKGRQCGRLRRVCEPDDVKAARLRFSDYGFVPWDWKWSLNEQTGTLQANSWPSKFPQWYGYCSVIIDGLAACDNLVLSPDVCRVPR